MLKENLLYNLKRAASFITNKEYKKAIAIYKQLLAEIPSFPDAYYGLYKANYLQNEKENAKIYLQQALRQLIISSKENEQHKVIFQKWELEYREAFKESFLTPLEQNIESKFKQSIIKDYNNGKYLEATKSLKKLNRYDLELLKISFNSYIKLKVVHEAIEKAYELLYYMKEYDEELLVSIAILFEKSQLMYPAVQVNLYLAKVFNKAKYYGALGGLSIKLDNNPQAKKFLKKALELDKNIINYYLILGQLYSAEGEFEKLEQLFVDAKKFTENSCEKLIALMSDIDIISKCKLDKELIYNNIQDSLYFVQHQLFYAGIEEAEEVIENIQSKHTFTIAKSKIRDKTVKQKSKDFENIISFHSSGRGGSFFFHALVDGHKEVATIPGVYLKGYFGLNVFNSIVSADKKNMIEKFMNIYEAIFDADSFKGVPGDPMSGKIKLGATSGLTTLGENRDIILKVDRDKFARKLYAYLDKFSTINEKDFFNLVHIVWEEIVRGDSLKKKKTIFYHIHNPTYLEHYRYLNCYKKAKDLVIIRSWLQGLESWLDSDIPVILKENWLGGVSYENKLAMFKKQYASMYRKIYTKFFVERYKVFISHEMYYVKLEDIKNAPEATMREVAKMMNIEYDEVLVHPSFLGLKFHSNSSKRNKNISEFDKASIKRKIGILFSDSDAVLLNTVFRPWNETFEYEEGEFKYVSVEEALKMNENIMDWEYKVAAMYDIKEEDIQSVVKYRKQKLALALNTQEQVYEELKKVKLIKPEGGKIE